MAKYPEVTVGAFIRNQKNQILLIKSAKWGNKIYVVPGGHIEIGETIENALKREVLEEIGVEVDFIRLVSISEAIFPNLYYKRKHFIFLECECKIKNGQKIKVDNREIQEARWFSLKDAQKQNTDPYTKAVLKKLES